MIQRFSRKDFIFAWEPTVNGSFVWFSGKINPPSAVQEPATADLWGLVDAKRPAVAR